MAVAIWIELNKHIMSMEDVDVVIEYLGKNPVRPSIYAIEKSLTERWSSWARKKIDI
mgnify:CR=1 FL=1